eukprot:gb/GEZN01017402.1/.p1 GENE.gb/GEZN01017402.1/~~gb/GEZN01017402.1/.p1  ORF type:complete len:125 (+),score=28.61 gb/GEZN01017402.1/:321-695(+)
MNIISELDTWQKKYHIFHGGLDDFKASWLDHLYDEAFEQRVKDRDELANQLILMEDAREREEKRIRKEREKFVEEQKQAGAKGVTTKTAAALQRETKARDKQEEAERAWAGREDATKLIDMVKK